MKAWQIDRLGGQLHLNNIAVPQVRPGSVLVRVEAQSVMSYLKDYIEGKLPAYRAPEGASVPGGNAIGVIEAVGDDVWHLKTGQRVVVSSHFVARENVPEPAQILIGVTSPGGIATGYSEPGGMALLRNMRFFLRPMLPRLKDSKISISRNSL